LYDSPLWTQARLADKALSRGGGPFLSPACTTTLFLSPLFFDGRSALSSIRDRDRKEIQPFPREWKENNFFSIATGEAFLFPACRVFFSTDRRLPSRRPPFSLKKRGFFQDRKTPITSLLGRRPSRVCFWGPHGLFFCRCACTPESSLQRHVISEPAFLFSGNIFRHPVVSPVGAVPRFLLGRVIFSSFPGGDLVPCFLFFVWRERIFPLFLYIRLTVLMFATSWEVAPFSASLRRRLVSLFCRFPFVFVDFLLCYLPLIVTCLFLFLRLSAFIRMSRLDIYLSFSLTYPPPPVLSLPLGSIRRTLVRLGGQDAPLSQLV